MVKLLGGLRLIGTLFRTVLHITFRQSGDMTSTYVAQLSANITKQRVSES